LNVLISQSAWDMRASPATQARFMATSNPYPIDRGKIRAVIFDMDGVVVDSEPVHERALMATAQSLGRSMSVVEAKSFKGSTEKLAAELMRDFTGTDVAVEEIIRKRLLMVRELFHEVTLMDGVIDFIATCQKKGWILALATSAQRDMQELIFSTFGLAPYFPTVVTGSDVTRSKPDPEPYLKAAAKLGLEAGACLVVEDAKLGIASGKSAGCQVVGITTSFPKEDLLGAGADLVVDTFIELAGYLDAQKR
jgi:HAD superfamily hydrolase (TIGR01509 family)